MIKTESFRKEDVKRKWYVVDAEGKVLGRLATEVANILRGKNKTIWTPHVDTGDFVIVLNAQKIKVTGNKLADKIYYRHSGYIGGLKKETLSSLLERKPEAVIHNAVKGMLPKTKLGRQMIKKLKVYKDDKHPHEAQNPEPLQI